MVGENGGILRFIIFTLRLALYNNNNNDSNNGVIRGTCRNNEYTLTHKHKRARANCGY